MPRLWPDPRDNEPPSAFNEKIVYILAAVIGASMIANLVGGLFR